MYILGTEMGQRTNAQFQNMNLNSKSNVNIIIPSQCLLLIIPSMQGSGATSPLKHL